MFDCPDVRASLIEDMDDRLIDLVFLELFEDVRVDWFSFDLVRGEQYELAGQQIAGEEL